MIEVGDSAPRFTAPIASGESYNDVDEFSLADSIGDGPVVLVFVPAAFTGWCSSELGTFGEHYDAFEAFDADVYGVSVDLPFAQNVWADELDLPFPLVADTTHEIIESYGVVREGLYDVVTVAQRSVFVIDGDGRVSYRWVEDTDEEPDWEALVEAVIAAVEAVAAH